MKYLGMLLSKSRSVIKDLFYTSVWMMIKIKHLFTMPWNIAISKEPKLNREFIGLVKGHQSPEGELIYHIPGDPDYERIEHAVLFISEYEAMKAGYRKWNM
ncbi:sunset domain-containing protein [Halobacillus mangrovi]|uniref:sunset domain-containing protein n=1 Tax=Halobacillus mangrovi TaxID=402384 RepID=UPI003D9775AE